MRFYLLREVVGTSHETEFETAAPTRLGEADRCPVCGLGFVSMKPWLPPYRAKLHTWGKAIGDVAFGPGNELLVSERFRRGWLDHGLKGLDTFDAVEIVRVTPRKLAGAALAFFCILPRIGSTSLDFERSRIERTGNPACLSCGRDSVKTTIDGVAIAADTWGGEDIFRPLGLTGSITVSERFHDMVTAHGLTNANMIPVEQYIWPPSRTRSN